MLDGTDADLVSDLATAAAYRAVWAGLEYRERPKRIGKLMLLSGGLDSAAVAALERPARALFINYGQLPGEAERQAARAVAQHLHLDLDELDIDLSAIGTGLLSGRPQIQIAPTAEWFPFRNQHLVTVAAAHALARGLGTVILGLVSGDSDRHADGTPAFLATLNTLVRSQEGGLRVLAPHINSPSSHELLARSGLPEEIVQQTDSCHISNIACEDCPGCIRRDEILSQSLDRPAGTGPCG